MSLANEMHIYDSAEVSCFTGETQSYDAAFFPNVVRKIEFELIENVLKARHPTFILDFGCGSGWLSRRLNYWGFRFVGVDLSKNMVKNAKKVCPSADFIVCDAMQLPFKENVFSFGIGISILHHLKLEEATKELKRISNEDASFLFMEPNALNPLSAFGRRVFPTEVHTDGERPYTPSYLKHSLNSFGFSVDKCFSIFFFSFPLARFSKILYLRPPSLVVKVAYFVERVMTRSPISNYLNSTIVITGAFK